MIVNAPTITGNCRPPGEARRHMLTAWLGSGTILIYGGTTAARSDLAIRLGRDFNGTAIASCGRFTSEAIDMIYRQVEPGRPLFLDLGGELGDLDSIIAACASSGHIVMSAVALDVSEGGLRVLGSTGLSNVVRVDGRADADTVLNRALYGLFTRTLCSSARV